MRDIPIHNSINFLFRCVIIKRSRSFATATEKSKYRVGHIAKPTTCHRFNCKRNIAHKWNHSGQFQLFSVSNHEPGENECKNVEIKGLKFINNILKFQSTTSLNPNNIACAKTVNNANNGVNFNFKSSSSCNNNTLPNNAIPNKFIGSYKSNNLTTTRNISVPLPLPIDIDSKNNDSKDRVSLIQGKFLKMFKIKSNFS